MAVAPNVTKVFLVWRVMTAPRAKPDTTMSASDLFSHFCELTGKLAKFERRPEAIDNNPQAKQPHLSDELK
jgi:hypothetical protein